MEWNFWQIPRPEWLASNIPENCCWHNTTTTINLVSKILGWGCLTMWLAKSMRYSHSQKMTKESSSMDGLMDQNAWKWWFCRHNIDKKFSKAFDNVAPAAFKENEKPCFYSCILACVEAFLSNRMQRVRVDGWFSPCIDDISGIPTS